MKRIATFAALALLGWTLGGFPVHAQQLHGDRPGADHSANAPSLAGLTLLATIAADPARTGGLIQAQCTAGVTVVLDDQAGALTATIVVLAGAAANGGQGGSLSLTGMPHTGRIRIYSSASGCQMAARAW